MARMEEYERKLEARLEEEQAQDMDSRKERDRLTKEISGLSTILQRSESALNNALSQSRIHEKERTNLLADLDHSR